MATIRALSGDWSLSAGFRRYFSCCFASSKSKDGSHQGERVVHSDHDLDDKEKVLNGDLRSHSYGSLHSAKSLTSDKSHRSKISGRTDKSRSLDNTGRYSRTEGDGAEILDSPVDPDPSEPSGSPVKERREVIHVVSRNKKEGSSYAYEEQDTSSDSDDEVLRHYHQSIQRVPSKHSVHSQKSSASKANKSSHETSDPPASGHRHHGNAPSERGGSGEINTTSFSQSPPPDEDRSYPPSQHSGAASSTHHKAPSVAASSHAGRPGTSTSKTYANNGYVQDTTSPEQVSPTSTEQALSAYNEDGSGSMGDEHLFDVSDLQDREPVLISKCGNLEVTFDYDPDNGRMNITIHRAADIPSKDRGGANNTQVRLLLLPTKKFKHKTKVKQGENPEYMETFTFKVPSEEVGSMGVRFRLYGCERMRRERMIGEVITGFANINLDQSTTLMLTLEPRSNLSHGDSKMDVSSLSRSDSASSTQSMQHGGMPELLIGLTYNGTTGRLSVEIIKGSNFKNMAMNRAPDTYVKLTLMSPNGQEIAHSKTSIRRGQPNPLYKETFMFQVALFQLPDVTLMTSVYNKKSMKRKEMIGWFSLGYSSSGEEEIAHWNDMRESKGEPVCRWHVLLEA